MSERGTSQIDEPATDDAVVAPAMQRTWIAVGSTLAVLALLGLMWLMVDVGLVAWSTTQASREAAWKSALAAPLPSVWNADTSTSITLERTYCFGSCPVYRVTLYATGRVEYVGYEYVCEAGAQTAQVDAPEATRLLRAALAASFFEMSDAVDPTWTDAPSAQMSLSHDGRVHVVRHYHGDTSAPRLLTWIEDGIDAVAGTKHWVGTPTESGRKCLSNGKLVEPSWAR